MCFVETGARLIPLDVDDVVFMFCVKGRVFEKSQVVCYFENKVVLVN
jgi:hypothetical protein